MAVELSDIDFEDDDELVNSQEENFEDDIDLNVEFSQNQSEEESQVEELKNPFEGFGNKPGTGDVLLDYLKYNGISDPTKIKFEDEEGLIKEVSWDDLSYDEKMNILRSSSEQPERDLEDNEIEFINQLRTANMTPQQYIEAIRQKAQNDYIESMNNTPQYSIDDLSDDEIFILDLLDKIEDITDEEIELALSKAKENESLFNKQVSGLRNVLKQQEELLHQQQAAELQLQREEQFNQFKTSVIENIQDFNKIGDIDIDLDQDDMEDVASFILDTDETGMSYFGKALNDPKSLVEMAWFALKGRDAFKSITEYYNNEIKNVRLKSYEKGLEDGKKGTSKVVINKSSKTKLNSLVVDYLDLLG